ncbi:hypothetical protein AB4Y45_35020 [Paraburkholderia sp. EG287A]|uniref:hypothetical protein n=1 Tax=Paraburkholderia sp. EG287A TaxID=3237012 RepID=UPI0034D2DDBD
MKSTLIVAALAMAGAVSTAFAAAPAATASAPVANKAEVARVSAALNARIPTPAGFKPIRPQENVSTPATPVARSAGQLSQVLNKAALNAQPAK